MTLLTDAATYLVEEYGETVEVVQGDSYEPEDSTNPIYFQNKDEADKNIIEVKARVMDNPSEETLTQYGFDQEAETAMHFVDDVVEEGYEIRYQDSVFVVSDVASQQVGDGPYRWVAGCKRKE